MVLSVLLLAGTVLYLAALPHNLGAADEAVYLYEAKRVLADRSPAPKEAAGVLPLGATLR